MSHERLTHQQWLPRLVTEWTIVQTLVNQTFYILTAGVFRLHRHWEFENVCISLKTILSLLVCLAGQRKHPHCRFTLNQILWKTAWLGRQNRLLFRDTDLRAANRVQCKRFLWTHRIVQEMKTRKCFETYDIQSGGGAHRCRRITLTGSISSTSNNVALAGCSS